MKTQPISVLVIDNEPAICMSLAAYLEDVGFQVATAESAEEALKLISKTCYNVAIVDLRLPEMSGEAWILQAHPICPEMRFIIHTGSVNYSVSQEMIQLGMSPEDILRKPQPDLSGFAACIRRLAAKPHNPESLRGS